MRKTLLLLLVTFLLISCKGSSSGGSTSDNGPTLNNRLVGEWYGSIELYGILNEYTLTIEEGYGVEEYKYLSYYSASPFTIKSIYSNGEITLDYFEAPETRTDLFTLFENDQKLEVCRNKNLNDCMIFDRVK